MRRRNHPLRSRCQLLGIGCNWKKGENRYQLYGQKPVARALPHLSISLFRPMSLRALPAFWPFARRSHPYGLVPRGLTGTPWIGDPKVGGRTRTIEDRDRVYAAEVQIERSLELDRMPSIFHRVHPGCRKA